MSNLWKKRTVTILAWLFIAGSSWALVWDLGWPTLWMRADPEATYVFRAVVDGKSYTSWGLTYVGESGHWLRLAEFAGVVIAAGLSVLRQVQLRRLGLIALVAWAGLWLGNSVWMAVVAPIHVFFLAAGFMVVFFAATVARARLSWTRGDDVGGSGSRRRPHTLSPHFGQRGSLIPRRM